MSEPYEPASDFLKAVIADEVPFAGSVMDEESFRHLIAMTRDDDRSNRDWATMLVAQHHADTSEVRAALLAAAQDEDHVVRAEAILGLALRDTGIALPLVGEALLGNRASAAVFEAAAIIADVSLIDLLRPWTEKSENEWLDQLAHEALAACERSADGMPR